jgi:hypothetical protein
MEGNLIVKTIKKQNKKIIKCTRKQINTIAIILSHFKNIREENHG